MRLARELELRLERLVDGASAALFRGRLHPVDIADRLIRQVDFLQFESAAGPQIPNRIEVRLSPAELDPEVPIGKLRHELAHALTVTAADRSWRTGGPVEIDVVTDEAVPRGLLECEGEAVPGPLPPWGQFLARDGSTALDLTDNRSLVGRELDCDIVISQPAVSRYHAVVARQLGAVQIEDLSSSNGTFVNDHRIAEPTPIVPGDGVTFGDAAFTYRPV